jgi:hypothetical protein
MHSLAKLTGVVVAALQCAAVNTHGITSSIATTPLLSGCYIMNCTLCIVYQQLRLLRFGYELRKQDM